MEDGKGEEGDVVVRLIFVEDAAEGLVAVEMHYAAVDIWVVGGGDASEEFVHDPFFFAGDQGGHNLSDGFFGEFFRAWNGGAGGGGARVIAFIVGIIFASLARTAGLFGADEELVVVKAEGFEDVVAQTGAAAAVVGLGLASDVANTIWFAAVTRLWISAVSINVVIKNELFAGFDIPFCKNSHPQLVANYPFVDITIWITTVVAKSPQTALFRRIDEFSCLQTHKVEMLDASLSINVDALSEPRLINDFADILVDEKVFREKNVRSESESLFVGFYDGNIGILSPLEAHILTIRTATTIVWSTFHSGHTVYAV